MNNSLYGLTKRTRTFSQIYPKFDDFRHEMVMSPFLFDINDSSREIIYYMLYANYANNHIASSDEVRFKHQLMYYIDSYAPMWERKVKIQRELRHLTMDELMSGAKNISNHAFNPPTEASTSSLEDILEIDNQTTSSVKRSKVDALSLLNVLLKDDMNAIFISKFKDLFMMVVEPEEPLAYAEEDC